MENAYYKNILTVLLVIFIFRVMAQLLQAIYPVTFIPSFEVWHSDTLSYPILLVSQIVIILVFCRIIWKLHNDLIKPELRWGRALLVLGGIYFIVMLFRLVAGLTFAADHSWLGATLPAIYHLNLASFILIYAFFHIRYGKKII